MTRSVYPRQLPSCRAVRLLRASFNWSTAWQSHDLWRFHGHLVFVRSRWDNRAMRRSARCVLPACYVPRVLGRGGLIPVARGLLR
jgi:hypothetical protein